MMRIDFAVWKHYFLHNQQNLRAIDWEDSYRLTEAERRCIQKSVQQFQLGESSEGKHLIQQAKRYAERTGNHDYYEAVAAFIREEQRHARDLARFMRGQQLPTIRGHWVDHVFRKLRQFAGLELSVMVLITAEIIAKVYYVALERSTKSKTLQDLCDQILQDEEKHVEFQSETLCKLGEGRWSVVNRSYRLAHRVLLEGTLVVVWHQHRSVFRAGGYRFRDFLAACRKEFRLSSSIAAGIARLGRTFEG
ncbi:ferritin-like domain-containing protein [Paenibacillus sp. CF384]|uniref:ferritin-like domain-containing protein n=1 Tax=Paenibacillus sp. CF384 TaxID=1884382 RepID=UPI00089B533A|nr:ferritin-like domain-containing protein [Paenibacillus sp. CF384]SDW23423.1 hypothetical protein SAMN05518855_1001746 [Paenibacillus sp. CF384]